MKRKIILSVFLTIGLLVGCSDKQNTKSNNGFGFNRAMIKMADDTVITANVKKFRHIDGVTVIFTENGEKYRVADTDVTLYVEKPQEQ